MPTALPTLYSRTSAGGIQTWTIETEDDQIRTTYGLIDGKKTTSKWYKSTPTNVGRSNERSGAAQAIFEAKALWKKRTELGYHKDIKKIDSKTIGLDVMLAGDFEKFFDRIDMTIGALVQNKYNGVRCTAQLENGIVVLRSRGFKEWITVPHINADLIAIFKMYPNAKLDGELYNYDLRERLNELNSLVRQSKPKQADFAATEQMVRYYIYDGFDFTEELGVDTAYIDRKTFIDEKIIPYTKYCRFVETTLCKSREEIDALYSTFVDRGDEGAIIRVPSTGYEQGRRSRELLKYKPEYDDEGIIEEIIEGEGNDVGTAKKAVVRWKGKKFFATFMGTREQRAQILNDKPDWLGSEKVFKYIGLTGLGTPGSARIDPNNCIKGKQ